MGYVITRLRLLLNFLVDLNSYTGGGQEILGVVSMDKYKHPTLNEFSDIVGSLPLDITQSEGLRRTRIRLAELGKHVADSNQRCWFSLERPDIYQSRYPGLSRIKEALKVACASLPSEVKSFEQFSLMFARVVKEEQIDGPTVAFLGRCFDGLRTYMAMTLKRDEPERDMDSMDDEDHDEFDSEDASSINPTQGTRSARDLLGAAKLTQAVEKNAQEIKNFIHESSQRGFPVHWSELLALVAGLGVKLNRNQLAVVPRIVADIKLHGSWFFSSGEQPNTFKRFAVNSKSTLWFRGRPGGKGGDDGNSEGWCERMMKLHPQGLSRHGCIEVLKGIAPAENSKKLITHWCYWQHEKFVVQAPEEDRWIPNPALLCRSASERLQVAAGIQTDEPHPVGDDQPASGYHRRESNKEVTRQAQNTGVVIDKLHDLYLTGEIENYYKKDVAGFAFDRKPFIEFLRKELGLSRFNVESALGDLRPSDLESVAQERQWTKARWNLREIPNLLKELHQNCKFFVFMSNSFIANAINRMHPDRYMPAVSVGDFTRVNGQGSGDAMETIKQLVENNEIGYFYPGTTSFFVPSSQLLNYLALNDVFVNSSELGLILDKFSSDIVRQKPRFPNGFFSPEAVEHQLDKVIENFKLQRKSPLPGWNEFIAFYEDEICNGIKPYFGKKAGDLYVTLRNWLSDDPVELQKFLASTNVQKRKAPSTAAEASFRDAGSTSKKSRGSSKIAPHSTHAMPMANSPAWDAVGLPSEMAANFNGFLAQYQQLPRTLPATLATSTAAMTSGGVPLAASLRAGFHDTVTAQFVDMRSHLPAAGLYARQSPGNGDCLFTALLADDQLSTSQAQALRRHLAVALHGTPDTPAQSARNAREVANYLFQRDERNGPQQSLGIDEVPNRVRAGLEVLDGIYSDADLTIPLFCRLLDERAPPGTPPANVMLLSEMDGHVVIFTASDRTAIPLRHLSAVELQQTLRDLCAASAAMVILRGAHFDRVQPM
ncbi:hypothetical protein BH10PSE18_BH10PSE18_11840 [soil metagenome]